jgi:hypothetical protein
MTSCSRDYDYINYTIKNNSSKSVSFTFNNTSNTLNSNESVAYIINSGEGVFYPKNITFSGHIKSIILDRLNLGAGAYKYTFNNNIRYKLEIVNSLSIAVSITSDDNIDNNGAISISIPANTKVDTYIYTSKPNFKLTSDPFPVVFSYTFNNDILYLIIK